jgi:hypothetical protein
MKGAGFTAGQVELGVSLRLPTKANGEWKLVNGEL